MRPALALGLLVLSGCALPDLGLPPHGTADRAAFPALVPIGYLLAAADAPGRADPAGTDALSRRAERLRTRAAALPRSALDAADRASLDRPRPSVD